MKFLADLNLGEMIAIATQWTGPSKDAFLTVSEIAPLMPRIQEDLAALLDSDKYAPAEARLRMLTDQADGLDGRHDHLQRGLNHILFGVREVLLGLAPADTQLADHIDAARAELQPNGLAVITSSYEAEAGYSAQMVKKADQDLVQVLSQVPVVKGMTALELVHEIGNVGARLGNVEHEKSTTVAAIGQEAVPAAEVKRRMRAWATTVETVLNALDRSKASPEVITALRQPVVDAVEKARARRLAKRNAAKKKTEADKAETAKTEAGEAQPAKAGAETAKAGG